MTLKDLLLPGDCLLYGPCSLYGWLIAIKTYHPVSHCELYLGKGQSAASRDGLGVNVYPLRTDHIAYVLRAPNIPYWAPFWAWMATVEGQKYDWFGLLRFVWIQSLGTSNRKRMFCSEFLTRAYRVLGVNVFDGSEDADAIVPADFLKSPALTIVATANSLKDAA